MIKGRDVRIAREALGETQIEFAARFRVTQATVSRWEKFGLPEFAEYETVQAVGLLATPRTHEGPAHAGLWFVGTAVFNVSRFQTQVATLTRSAL